MLSRSFGCWSRWPVHLRFILEQRCYPYILHHLVLKLWPTLFKLSPSSTLDLFSSTNHESHRWSRCRSCSITQYGTFSVQIVTTSRPCCVEIASLESWGQLRLFQAQAQKPSRKVGQKPVTSKPKHTTASKVLVSAVLGMRLALVLDASISNV